MQNQPFARDNATIGFVREEHISKKRVDSIKRINTLGVNLLFNLAAPGKLMDSSR